ncbi:BAHD acyltransferase At5g47980 [Ziziphus jujuba]|nr:BAHD acyltransferase At5g47980-like [Ziziphus jujuba var. spinosa]XP_060671289.1 BAHD acyltransferase At5g47980 [Ziziphus jujuba]
MKVEAFDRETVKPSSPTPHHLSTLKLSLIDQYAPSAMYTPLLLFYPNTINIANSFSDNHQATIAAAQKSKRLKKTLSQTLTHFYPLAGRVRSNLYIDCNDEGAEYVGARTKCPMSMVLKNPDSEMLREFLPLDTESEEAGTGPLVLVQVTFFECGGMAIGLCISHKVGDASTLATFMKGWAAMAAADLGSGTTLLPEFGAASLFPPMEQYCCSGDSNLEPSSLDLVKKKCSTKRFVFDSSKIEALRSKATSENVEKPTRVEAISALIWKVAIQTSRKMNSMRPSVLCQCINLRKQMVPPLSENFLGNLTDYFAVKTEGSEIDLKGLVAMLRKGMEGFKEDHGKGKFDWERRKEKLEVFGKLPKDDGIDNYNFSSWCRFPFYEADFGWGKPIWVSIAGMVFKNIIFLLDTKDGDGIEAWFIFEENYMALFESNKELLAFASLNPSVI